MKKPKVVVTFEIYLTVWKITATLPSGEFVDALAQSDDQIVETVAWLRGKEYSDRFRRGLVIQMSWVWLEKHSHEEVKMSLNKFYEDSPLQFESV